MYILYFIAVMIAPVAIFLVGLMWRISPPPFQKKGLAYSTELTRSDPDAWSMAHRHCSKLWLRIGVISGAASAALMTIFSDSYTAFWLWLIVAQMVLFCISVFMVDLLLKATFDDRDKKSE